MQQQPCWIVTADARCARLFACRRLPGGGTHLDLIKSMENPHRAEQNRHRPALVGGAERSGSVARSGAHAVPHAIAPRDTLKEAHRRFARDVCDWLSGAQQELGEGQVTVFAPAKFLNLLRQQLAGRQHPAETRQGEFTRWPVAELAAHPEMLAAIAGR